MTELPNEFARPVDSARLPHGETVREIAANEAERRALAARFELLALDRLEATVRLRRLADGSVRLSAHLIAEATQACVTTLAPVPARIEDDFTLRYAPLAIEEELALDSEAETVEPLGDGVIDIGEAVAQQLSLALDPYPQAAARDAPEAAEPAAERASSPFAVLASRLKPGQ